jgi:hypothetical protein
MYKDLSNLSVDQKTNLKIIGGPIISEYLDRLEHDMALLKSDDHLSRGYTRKLSDFSDIEGKTREIAILDFWSQSVLFPLHLYIYKMLKRIKGDCTFNQGAFHKLTEG